jgi:hypothetical protein
VTFHFELIFVLRFIIWEIGFSLVTTHTCIHMHDRKEMAVTVVDILVFATNLK